MCVKVSALLLAIFCCTEIVVIAVTVAVFVDYADYNISAVFSLWACEQLPGI